MSWLQQTLKKHLLFSALLLSTTLHLLVIFWDSSEQLNQSSLGNNQLILLEPSKKPEPAVSAKDENTKSTPTKEKVQSGKGKPTLTGKTKKSEQEVPIQENVLIQKKSEESLETTKATSNAGEQLDQSGKELSSEDKYKNLVLAHFLSKAQSAPINGEATIHITLIRAGIATQIKIEMIKGGKRYQNWLQRQILNANPFPAFPSDLKNATLQINLPIRHEAH
jgi:protein TonB